MRNDRANTVRIVEELQETSLYNVAEDRTTAAGHNHYVGESTSHQDAYSILKIPHGLFVVAHYICRDCGKSLIVQPNPMIVDNIFRRRRTGYTKV